MDSEEASKLAEDGANVLEQVRQKFIEADLAFFEEAEKQRVNPIAAMVALISLHRMVADNMEAKLIEVVGNIAPKAASADKEE